MQNTQFRLDGIHPLLGRTADVTTSTASSTTSASTTPATPSPAATPPTTATATPAADSPTATDSPAAAAAPTPKSAKSPRSRSGDTAQKINQIIDAMIHWNSSQLDNQSRLRVSIPPVKALASAIGANYQATIQQVFKERESELNELYARFMLGSRHNATVPH